MYTVISGSSGIGRRGRERLALVFNPLVAREARAQEANLHEPGRGWACALMAGLVGIRAEDMEQVDALRRARAEYPNGFPFIRPHVLAPVLVRTGTDLEMKKARFGFSRRFASFNARSDRLTTSPLWRSLLGKGHAIVPLSYVVEWKEQEGERRPYLVQRADGRLMMAPALVGAYHEKEGELAFAICTREPNRFFSHFHDRMIGQCTPDLMERWLTPEGRDVKSLLECIHAPGEDELVAVPASPDLQKRKSGDWSPVKTEGPPISAKDLEAAPPRRSPSPRLG